MLFCCVSNCNGLHPKPNPNAKPVHRRILEILNTKYQNDIKRVKDKPVIIIKDQKTHKIRRTK